MSINWQRNTQTDLMANEDLIHEYCRECEKSYFFQDPEYDTGLCNDCESVYDNDADFRFKKIMPVNTPEEIWAVVEYRMPDIDQSCKVAAGIRRVGTEDWKEIKGKVIEGIASAVDRGVKFDNITAFMAYVWTIVKNQRNAFWYKYYRTTDITSSLDSLPDPDWYAGADCSAESEASAYMAMDNAIEQLSPPLREIAALRAEGLTLADTADMLGISYAAAQKRAKRAELEIKDFLSKTK